jgi:hypothetical protein
MLSWTLWLIAAFAPPITPVASSPDALSGCGTDAYEPNDLRRKAKRLQPGAGQKDVPRLEAATCESDFDWYRVHFERGKTVVLTLHHHPTAKLVAPQIFKPNGRKPIGRVKRGKGQTRLRFRTPRTGDYKLRISGDDATRTVYSIEVSIR